MSCGTLPTAVLWFWIGEPRHDPHLSSKESGVEQWQWEAKVANIFTIQAQGLPPSLVDILQETFFNYIAQPHHAHIMVRSDLKLD